jgi:hypothetical protein
MDINGIVALVLAIAGFVFGYWWLGRKDKGCPTRK